MNPISDRPGPDRPNRPDLDAFWMPFTANRQFKADPRLLVAASGMYYRTEDGREVMDGASGLWCCNAGHGREEIAAAVGQQLLTLDYAPSFQMGHPLAFDFATALAKIAPAGLDRIFFANSGRRRSIRRCRSRSPIIAPAATASGPGSSGARRAITGSASAASR